MIILIPYDKLYADKLPDQKDFYSLLSSFLIKKSSNCMEYF